MTGRTDGGSKMSHLIRSALPLGFLLLLGYFQVRIRSIDYVSFAFAYVDLAPIYIGIYGVFLAFLSAGIAFTSVNISTSSKVAYWAIAVLQIWAIVETTEAYVRLRACLNLPIIDGFELTTQTGAISWAFFVSITSFLFGVTFYTLGGMEEFIRFFLPSRRRRPSREMSVKSFTPED